MQLGTSQSGVFYRDVSCLWTMAGAAMMHLVFTFPAIVLLFVAVTKGEGIEYLFESVLIIPGLFVITYGFTLVAMTFGRATQYDVDVQQGIHVHVPLLLCFMRRPLEVQRGPIVKVERWDGCSKLWHGQPNAPLEVTYVDSFLCGMKRSYYLFPRAGQKDSMHELLTRRVDFLDTNPLIQPPAYTAADQS